ncbi:MAG: hypothetical protein E7382_02610 [Clostridiales bacterium]|nr:hypothetical protein [Clostridiales bacterium]
MYFYFSATFPSAIKLNGIYYGIITDTIKSVRLDLESDIFVEVCPLNAQGEQMNFILNEQFLCSPPEQVKLTNLKGGYLVKFTCPNKKEPFTLLAQEKYPDLLATVYKENGLKASLEINGDFCLEQFPFSADSATMSRFELFNECFLAIEFCGKEPWLVLYKVSGKIEKVLMRSCKLILESNVLKTQEDFIDMAKHTVISEWEYKNGELYEKSRQISAKKLLDPDKIPLKLVPYAFLEELSVGGCIESFLCENVKKNADKLKAYLGEFIGVIPPPIFRRPDEVGVVLIDGNGYKVDYFTFDFERGKICNIKKSAD